MNAHAQPIRGRHSLARVARVLDRAIPSPLLAIPPLWLALGLLSLASLRIRADTWFDLAAGRDIVQHGLPHSDRLMALTAGHSWQDQQWLAHLTSYGLFDLGGLPLVSLVDAGCLVLALSIAILAARSFGGSPLWIAAVASPLILIQVPSETRAQSFAMPLFAALVWLLSRDARRPDRRILLVLPLLALWANLHGSILIACVLVLLRCAVGAGTALRGRRLRDLWRYVGLAAAAVLAPLASPYGLEMLDYYRSTATNGAFRSVVVEWAGTDLRGWFGPVFFLLAGLAIVGIARPEIRLGLFDCLCLVFLVLIGIDTLRNVVWLPYAAVILLPAGLARWSPESGSARLRPLLQTSVVTGAIGLALLASQVTTPALNDPWPAAQGATVARAAAADPSLRIVSDEAYSDWLVWRYPALRGRVAFDVRFELLGSKGITSVARFKEVAGLNWNRPFAGYRLALVDRAGSPRLVYALLAERGRRVLSRHEDVYAILRPPAPR
ncbi:MAG: hypothetical protein M3Q31_17235 [Actinomycetota bacterium]|nr:hypothetical protein [Actinomycetota bacterium]